MDVDKLVWLLQNGSDFAKTKLMSLLNNVKSVIDAEMVRPDTDSSWLNRAENDNYVNGNQKEVVNPEMDSSKQNGYGNQKTDGSLPIDTSDCVLVSVFRY